MYTSVNNRAVCGLGLANPVNMIVNGRNRNMDELVHRGYSFITSVPVGNSVSSLGTSITTKMLKCRVMHRELRGGWICLDLEWELHRSIRQLLEKVFTTRGCSAVLLYCGGPSKQVVRVFEGARKLG